MTKEYVHIAKISHDGSGTVVTGIHVIRCIAPRYCTWCAKNIGAMPLIVDEGSEEADRRATGGAP